jgi:hypothetical protein
MPEIGPEAVLTETEARMALAAASAWLLLARVVESCDTTTKEPAAAKETSLMMIHGDEEG